VKEPFARRSSATDGLLKKLTGFAFVSAAGLAIDVCLFLSLVNIGLRPGFSNLLSAATAVTFVFMISTKRVFSYRGRFLFQLFFLYAVYQSLAVIAASWAVDKMVNSGIISLAAKGLILPVTFTTNYVFMHFLTRFGR
jgi:hypothetical protein